MIPFCCWTIPREQGSKRWWFGANYSQHVLYTPFNELDWKRGHWLWLPHPVIQDEPRNLPHVHNPHPPILLPTPPVMCTKSPSTSNSLLGLHWSRDEAALKQHNSSHCVSAHQGRGFGEVEERGKAGEGGGQSRELTLIITIINSCRFNWNGRH